MKSPSSIVVVLVLSVCALFFATANRSGAGQSTYSRGADGVLRMKHSPTLGINIPIAVWIDGQQSGVFARGHVYERSLSPGRHSVYASRPGQLYASFYGMLDVQPGQTYSFVVKSNSNQIYLIPVGRID
jgi:hypothetical protein